MTLEAALFFTLAGLLLACAAGVILARNPVFSALFLALSMVKLAFFYLLLQAYFLAAVQLAVYAGAVMVLFVMVLMLFDLKKQKQPWAPGRVLKGLKLAAVLWLLGLLAGGALTSTDLISQSNNVLNTSAQQMQSTQSLGKLLFSEYVFAFEALGVLLLVVAVGVVAVSRARGGAAEDSANA